MEHNKHRTLKLIELNNIESCIDHIFRAIDRYGKLVLPSQNIFLNDSPTITFKLTSINALVKAQKELLHNQEDRNGCT